MQFLQFIGVKVKSVALSFFREKQLVKLPKCLGNTIEKKLNWKDPQPIVKSPL